MRLHWILSLSVLALAGMNVGCSGMFKDVAEEITPAVVTSAVTALADPDMQRFIVAAIDEGRVKAVASKLSAAILDGLLDTLEDPTRRKRLEAIVDGLTTMAAGSAVDSMIEHVLDEKVAGRVRLVMRGAMTELVGAVFETVGSKMGTPEERTMALGSAVHEIAKQATLGFQDALDDTRRDRASGKMVKEDGALIIAASSASLAGSRILWTLGIGLSAVVLGLAITLIWAIRKNRLRRSELAQRDGALLLLTEAINSTATHPGAEEFHAVLKSSIRDRAGVEHIRKVLGEKGHHLLGIDKLGKIEPLQGMTASPVPLPPKRILS